MACGEFGPTLKDIVALTCLPMFEEVKAIKLPGDSKEIAPNETDKKKLEVLNNALSESKSSNNSQYGSWIKHFENRMGMASKIEFEAVYLTGFRGMFCRAAREWPQSFCFSSCNPVG